MGSLPSILFPARLMDVEACYRGLVDKGINKIAVVGDRPEAI